MEKKLYENTDEMPAVPEDSTVEEKTVNDGPGDGNTEAGTVTLSRKALRQLLLIPAELESADQGYLACQATVFRIFAHALYTAPNTRAAIAEAKRALGAE